MPARKYFYTKQTDDVIRDAYIRMRRSNDRTALRRAAAMLGWPKFQIKERARELGLTQPHSPNWSEAEIAIVERYSWMSDIRLGKKLHKAGFPRSANAVRQMKYKLAINGDGNGQWYTTNELARAFGVDYHKVEKWIQRGWLRAIKQSSEKTHSRILHGDVRRFARIYLDEYDLAKVHKHWFIEMLVGRIGSPLRVMPERRIAV